MARPLQPAFPDDLPAAELIFHGELDLRVRQDSFVAGAFEVGGGDFGPPRQVSADRGLADLDAELEQFAVDAGAPQSGLARLN